MNDYNINIIILYYIMIKNTVSGLSVYNSRMHIRNYIAKAVV